jgi:hypothetical protein
VKEAAVDPDAGRPERKPTRPSSLDSSVSFAELVWAGHNRQNEVASGLREGEWEQECWRRLCQFKLDHGEFSTPTGADTKRPLSH